MAEPTSFTGFGISTYEMSEKLWRDYDAQIDQLNEIANTLTAPQDSEHDSIEEPIIPAGTAVKIVEISKRAIMIFKTFVPDSKRLEAYATTIMESAANPLITKGRITALISLLNHTRIQVHRETDAKLSHATLRILHSRITDSVWYDSIFSKQTLDSLSPPSGAEITYVVARVNSGIKTLTEIVYTIPRGIPFASNVPGTLTKIQQVAEDLLLVLSSTNPKLEIDAARFRNGFLTMTVGMCIRNASMPLRKKAVILISLFQRALELTFPTLTPPATALSGTFIPATAAAAPAAPISPEATPIMAFDERVVVADAMVNDIYRRMATLPPDPALMAPLQIELAEVLKDDMFVSLTAAQLSSPSKLEIPPGFTSADVSRAFAQAAPSAATAALLGSEKPSLATLMARIKEIDFQKADINNRMNALPRDPVLLAQIEAELKTALEAQAAAYTAEREGKPREWMFFKCTAWSTPSPHSPYWNNPVRFVKPISHFSFDTHQDFRVEVGGYYLWIELENREDGNIGLAVCCDASPYYTKKSFTIQFRFMLKNRAGDNVCSTEWNRCTFASRSQTSPTLKFTMAQAIAMGAYDPAASLARSGDNWDPEKDVFSVACEIVQISPTDVY